MTKKLLWKLHGYVWSPTAPNRELNCRTVVVLTMSVLGLLLEFVRSPEVSLIQFIWKGPGCQGREEGWGLMVTFGQPGVMWLRPVMCSGSPLFSHSGPDFSSTGIEKGFVSPKELPTHPFIYFQPFYSCHLYSVGDPKHLDFCGTNQAFPSSMNWPSAVFLVCYYWSICSPAYKTLLPPFLVSTFIWLYM